MTLVRKGGIETTLVKRVTVGSATRTALKPSGVVTVLIVAQLRVSTLLILRIDLE